MHLALPTVLTLLSALIFLTLERVRPGRELPNSKGWYARAALINLCQVAITFGTNKLWIELFSGASLVKLAAWNTPVLEGFVGWLVGTFFFYWWHRIRHLDGFWHVFHQVHHSPARIEAITSFYKHPIEILADSALAAAILYLLLGASLEGALWFNFFAATGEFFYHSNFRSPRWSSILSRRPSCIRSTTSSTSTSTTSPTCRSGTASSAPTATRTSSPSAAASRTTTSASSPRC
jgi:sterol desaturase/sphingolipid hydroxylase (fatty acid hydroxylase superfamily)